MVLAMTLVVRDEEEILTSNLDYHLAEGVDVILVIDHGSSDGTAAILERYAAGGRVRAWREENPANLQPSRVGRLLSIARDEHQADWVIHGDADEFWMPTAGSLRDVLAAVPERYGYLVVQRHDFLPALGEEPFHQRMTVRYRRSLNLRGTTLEPKVAQRPAAADAVAHGNHSLVSPTMEPAPPIEAVEVLHFPMRTFAQFEAKVLKTGIGHELNPDREDQVGCDQLELLAKQRRGELRSHYERIADERTIQRGLESGELVLDRRLAEFLAQSPASVPESAPVQIALRRAWNYLGEVDDARHARWEATEHEREATAGALQDAIRQIERQQRHAENLEQTLETIRGSRLMRLTAPARRLYYRRRPS